MFICLVNIETRFFKSPQIKNKTVLNQEKINNNVPCFNIEENSNIMEGTFVKDLFWIALLKKEYS